MNALKVLYLAAAIRRIGAPASLRVLLLGGATCAVVLFIAFNLFRAERTFFVEATTSVFEVEFAGSGNHWFLSGGLACERRARPVPAALDIPGDKAQFCDPSFYVQRVIEGPDAIEWRDGTRLRITMHGTGVLLIDVLQRGDQALPAGTLLVVGADDLRASGALPFTGYLEIGSPVSSGQRYHLQAGRWEAREGGFATSLLRSNATEVVKSGELPRGSVAAILNGSERAIVHGFASAVLPDESPTALFLSAVSASGDTAIQLDQYGFLAPVVIRPDLIDVALSSPLLLTIALGLSLLASFAQVISDAFGQSKGNTTDTSRKRPHGNS